MNLDNIKSLLASGENATLLTAPLQPVKKEVLSTLSPLSKKGLTLYYLDFRELPDVFLSSLWQLFLTALGKKPETENPLVLLSQFKNALKVKKPPIIFILFNLQIIYPLYESFFSSMESLIEEREKINFLFHFAQNIKTERLRKQMTANFLPYQNIFYHSLPPNFVPPDLTAFFYLLTENEQVILRQLLAERLNERPEIKEDLHYLLETGIIKQGKKAYQIALPALEKFLLAEDFPAGGEFKIINETVFFAGENLTAKLTPSQNQLLLYFLKHQNRLIKRDSLGHLLWGKNWPEISDWALDKAIARLRRRLKALTGQPHLKVYKRKGVIFQAKREIPDSKLSKLKKKTHKALEFRRLGYNAEALNFHTRLFPKPAVNRYLFAATPKTRTEIATWLKNSVANPKFCYWSVFLKGKMVGHAGFKNLDLRVKTANLGTFIFPHELWSKIGAKIFIFLIGQAKEMGLEVLTHHPNKNNLEERRALERVGFRLLPGEETKLSLLLAK
jgi:DNA-binding winged helix-turn-helix (wHTH) protein